jgi:DNA-binding NtrC family response regulator
MVERAVILADDGVLPNPLPPSALQAITKVADPVTLKDCERAFILQTLEECDWVIGGPNGAAARLGIKRTTLYEQMKKFGIKRPSTRANIGASVGAGQQSEQLEQSDSSRPLFWARGACA